MSKLPEKVVIHINDTHPGMAIPELMRLLIDEVRERLKELREDTSVLPVPQDRRLEAAVLRRVSIATARLAYPTICMLAEGSLVQKGRCYRPELERLLELYGTEKRGIALELHVGQETTLPGSAAAALLNT